MELNHHERVRQATEAYNNCKGGRWFDANKFDLLELESLAATAMDCVNKGDWEAALRWTKRCVDMEKKVGFKNAPIWGEFGEAIERICAEISKSDST